MNIEIVGIDETPRFPRIGEWFYCKHIPYAVYVCTKRCGHPTVNTVIHGVDIQTGQEFQTYPRHDPAQLIIVEPTDTVRVRPADTRGDHSTSW